MKHLKSLTAASLTLSALALVSSCRDYDVISEQELTDKLSFEKRAAEYANAFEQAFGTPDPNHDWGMDEEIGVIEALSSPMTRAGNVNTNRNQWTEFDSKSSVTYPTYNNAPKNQVQVPNFKTSALGHDIQIPGFPHLNGLYYTANGNVLAETKTGDQVTSGMIPAGDVTPYEIQYVSNWFRTHKNPVSNVQLHLSDFFIQNISWDNDQVSYLESGYTAYKSGWEQTGNNGKNIETVAEAKAHKAWNDESYILNNNLNENISYFLDQLGFQDMEGNWTHVNNFNSGNSNFDPENKASNPNRMIMYVTSSGTENFRCHPSWCTDTQWIDSWVLVRLTWIETVKDSNSPYPEGTRIPREGYYLGFDFHGTKSGQTVNRDGYYSNWIVKITPGFFTPTGNSKRIFCEDLGGSFDWDFNDAVIDVAFEGYQGHYTPIISVQAAGGTMPIYVEKHVANYELHRLLGKSGDDPELKPINVGSTGGSHTVAIYRGTPVAETKAGKIKIYVENTKTTPSTNYQISGGTEDANGNASSVDDNNGSSSTLDGTTLPNKKVAPSAFSAPTSVKWMNELKNITLAYEGFDNWVANHAWKDTNSKNWYDVVKAGAPIFDVSIIEHGTGIVAPPAAGGGGYDEGISWTVLTPDAADESRQAAARAKADSYLRIEGYTGNEEAIFGRLNGLGNEGRVTCTVVLSSSTEYTQDAFTFDQQGDAVVNNNQLKGILVPADIDGSGNLSYKNTSFSINDMQSFKIATYVPSSEIKAEDRPAEGRYTYTLEFSFKKSDVIKSGSTYHGYFLFYLKGPDINVGDGDGTGVHGNVKVERWYVHY